MQPELGLNAKISFKSKRCVDSYASFAIYDLTYSIRRHDEIPRKFVNANVHRTHKILTQNFTRCNWIKKIIHAHFCTSMIIDDFDVEGVSVMPFKTDAPFFIDSNCILPLPFSLARVERISWIQHQCV